MKKPKFLYSTNVVLAYKIGKKYYQDFHYVWCSAKFGSISVDGEIASNPPTSRPLYRYKALQSEVSAGDSHGPYILSQKTGLIKGAGIKYNLNLITKAHYQEILAIIEYSPITEYKPLIYNIVYTDVEDIAKPVPIKDKATPISEEYVIENLPRKYFDILDYEK